MNSYLVGICAFNEGAKIRRVLQKFADYSWYDVLVIDDGSGDDSLRSLSDARPVEIIRQRERQGAGAGVREIIRYAKRKGYEAIFFVSGNDKDDPRDMDRLKIMMEKGYDFIQGSRYLPGGEYQGMPFYRIVLSKFFHPLIFSLITGRKITDSTNGFRAVRVSVLSDPRLNLDERWLNEYECEPYLLYKIIKLGYRFTEVPVKKIYPTQKEGYTKMRPWSGWWSILRPLIFLPLGIKR